MLPNWSISWLHWKTIYNHSRDRKLITILAYYRLIDIFVQCDGFPWRIPKISVHLIILLDTRLNLILLDLLLWCLLSYKSDKFKSASSFCLHGLLNLLWYLLIIDCHELLYADWIERIYLLICKWYICL